MKKLILIIIIIAILVTSATVYAQSSDESIGRPLWTDKCQPEASVIIQELPDGTNVVTCFLFW